MATYTVPGDGANHTLYDLDQALHPGFHTVGWSNLELQAELDGLKFGDRRSLATDDYEFELIQKVPRGGALYNLRDTAVRNDTGSDIKLHVQFLPTM